MRIFFRKRPLGPLLGLLAVLLVAMQLSGCTGCGEYNPEGEQERDDQPPKLIQPVRVFGSNGSDPGRFNEPRAMCFDKDGNLYVADFRNYRIQVFDKSLNLVKAVGEMGNRPKEFKDPCGILVAPNGDVLVSDTWNHRVQLFDNAFNPKHQTGGMVAPRGLAFGADGNYYVADSGNCKIRVFSPELRQIREFGGCGPRQGQMVEPVGIAFSRKGELWVCDNDNGRIEIFDPNGTYKREIPIKGWIKKGWREPYIQLMPDDTWVITIPEFNKIMRINEQGKILANWGGQGGEPGLFNKPTGVALGSDGLLYVLDTWNHRIQIFDPKTLQ